MKIEVTPELVFSYIKNNKQRHAAYYETVDIADHLKFHIDGYRFDMNKGYTQRENPYFNKLIDTMRPSESDTIKTYRRSIYIGKTKSPTNKVINSLKKIVKSPEWDISFDKSLYPPVIKEDETLEYYTEKKYPMFNSVENWAINYLLKENLSDPNGIVCIMPIDYEVEATEYVKPVALFIPSVDVYEYKADKLLVFKSNKISEYKSNDGKVVYKENVIVTINENEIWESRKLNTKGDWSLDLVYVHDLGKLPAFRSGGQYKTIIDGSPIYVSMIDGMLNGLDTAARECSDLDAEVVQHIYSTMWYYSGQECSTCNGTGKVLIQGKQSVCGSCSGEGVLKKSPFKDLVVKSPNIGEQQVPTPPAGYIIKPTDIVKIQDERIQKHIYDALSSINMEFLTNAPANQSGVAKAYDRDELNNFVYGVAYHFVEILNRVFYFINEYRYKLIVPDEKLREQMLPEIYVPETFDLLTANLLMEEISKARNSKQSILVINELEKEYAEKAFPDDDYITDKMEVINKIDPFIGLTIAEKNDLLVSGGIQKIDFIVSVYIYDFIEQAINANPDFYEWEYAKQREMIYKMANDKLNATQSEIKAIMDNSGQ